MSETDRLRATLLLFRTENHYVCDDCWYSCPKSDECCNDELPKDVCTCGVDLRNKMIDKALEDNSMLPDTWKHGAESMRQAILQQLPGGQTCDPQQIADMIRSIEIPDKESI